MKPTNDKVTAGGLRLYILLLIFASSAIYILATGTFPELPGRIRCHSRCSG